MELAEPAVEMRRRRREAGLTQGQLAARAGVSRQLVAAVEAGQNTPSVHAAIRLAGALDTTVEQLFAPVPAAGAVPALGETLRDGTPLRIGRVGSTLVASPLPDHGTAAGAWGLSDGVLRNGSLRLFERGEPDGLVLAGCDPALGLAEAMLPSLGPARLRALPAATGVAVASLQRGTLHAAAVHGRAGRLPAPPVPVLRLHLARWQVGLGIDPALDAGDLEAVLSREIPIIHRDRAAASQRALQRAARRLGRSPTAGPRAGGHIEAARLAAGTGRAAITTESAARAFGLRFAALEEHTVEIWVSRVWQEHPGVAALGELLCSRAFAERLGGFGGYDLDACGSVLD